MVIEALLFIVLGYVLGSIPWSVWLSRWIAKTDPRAHGDGNPGAANAYRVAGKQVGTWVVILDFLKGFIPVFIATWGFNFTGDVLFWIALMPLVGHAFSVFLRFRGGRGIVALFGVWAGLTLYEIPLLLGMIAFLSVPIIKNDEKRTLLLPVGLIVYLILTAKPVWMVVLAVVYLLIVVAKVSQYYRVQVIPQSVSPGEQR